MILICQSFVPDRFGVVVFLLAFDRSDLYNLCRIFFFVYEGVELSNGEKHRFSAWNGACDTSNLRLDCVRDKA